jgi:predicted NAD/FAD-dependent oxidoreductase
MTEMIMTELIKADKKNKPKIAVIGAGFSGIILARQLQESADVTIFEKSQGCGGRMSARYAKPFCFDHGIQCFTARTKIFQNFLRPFILAGDVAPWEGKVITFAANRKITKRIWFETHFVGCPNMNSLCKKLAKNLVIKFGTEVLPLNHFDDQRQTDNQKNNQNNFWKLSDKNNNFLGSFDFVISTAPPIQTANLFSNCLTQNQIFYESAMQPCFAMMIGFKKPWSFSWIAARTHNHIIKWISVNSSKPGRNTDLTCLVVHSRSSWSKQNLEEEITQIEQKMLKEFELITGINCLHADYISTHRWRYAIIEKIQKTEGFFDNNLGIAANSDWTSNSRIEDIWIAAIDLAKKIKTSYTISHLK